MKSLGKLGAGSSSSRLFPFPGKKLLKAVGQAIQVRYPAASFFALSTLSLAHFFVSVGVAAASVGTFLVAKAWRSLPVRSLHDRSCMFRCSPCRRGYDDCTTVFGLSSVINVKGESLFATSLDEYESWSGA